MFKEYRFKISNKEMWNGLLVYKCSKGLLTIGYVKVCPSWIFVTSRKEKRVDEIKKAYREFEKNEAPEEQECG